MSHYLSTWRYFHKQESAYLFVVVVVVGGGGGSEGLLLKARAGIKQIVL